MRRVHARDYDLKGPVVTALKTQDKALAPLFETVGDLRVVGFDDPFLCLVFFVLNQQISLKAAKTLYARLLGEGFDTPETFRQATQASLRALGISTAKITCLQAVATACYAPWFVQMENTSHERIERELLSIRGLGVWTVSMFRMFYLLDEDVFTTGDLGLRHALRLVLKQPAMSEADMVARSARWRPYRSVVAHYLWAFREGSDSVMPIR